MTLSWLPPAVDHDPTIAGLERFLQLAEARSSAGPVKYVPHEVQHWTPNAGPQSEFISSTADEVLYGGAAGGGKSLSEIILPLRWCNHPRFRALILRRETTRLQDLLDKAAVYYPLEYPGVRYRGDDDTWTFPSGAVVRFGHCKDVDDWQKYQGHEYHLIEFDELTEFTLKQYREITNRIRSAVTELPRYARAATNPGGSGHAFVFSRWAPWLNPDCVCEDWEAKVLDEHRRLAVVRGKGLPARTDEQGVPIPPAHGGRVLYVVQTVQGERFSSVPVVTVDGEPYRAKTRTFIPARLSDNPKLTEADPGYVQSLLDNDPVRVAQLLHGNWLVKPAPGLLFNRDWFEMVDADEVPMDGPCARVWDLAGTEPSQNNPDPDWTVGLLGSRASDGYYYVEHMVYDRLGPGGVRALVLSTAAVDGTDVPIRFPQDPGQAGKDQAVGYVQMLEGYSAGYKTVTGSKLVRAGVASAQASPHSTGGTTGRIRVVRGDWNEFFFSCLEAFPTKGVHDDVVDALSDLVSELTIGGSASVGVYVVG